MRLTTRPRTAQCYSVQPTSLTTNDTHAKQEEGLHISTTLCSYWTYRFSNEGRLRVNAQGTLCIPIYSREEALGPDYWVTILYHNPETHEWDPIWDRRMSTAPPAGIYRKADLSPPTFKPETFNNYQRPATAVHTD